MGRFVRRWWRNLSSVILALLLAFVVWISASLQNDPFIEQGYGNVPIALLNQPPETILFGEEPERVIVNVRARQSLLRDLRAADFQATMDLSGVEPGAPVDVPIEVTTSNENVRIQSWSPEEQPIHLEAMRTITLPVGLDVQGAVATGYEHIPPIVVPDQVSVYGPETLLTQVVTISGSLDITNAREDVVAKVSVTPQGVEGKVVPGLQWSPDQVEVRVIVRKKQDFKPDVEVVADLRGQPASGYSLGRVIVEPPSVTLAGPPSVLDELPSFVETMPISVAGATQDLFLRTALTLPTSVAVVGGNFVTVTVSVMPIESSRAMTATVEIRGVRPGQVATPSPSVVDVLLKGPAAILSELTSNSIQIIVNLLDPRLGIHRVEPDYLVPEGITVVSIVPATIEVLIELEPTPTRTPTPTPTPEATTQP